MGVSHGQRGFTLLEIIIAMVIIGVLAALAITKFMPSTTRAKQQSEVKQILKQVYTMQRAHWQEKDTYGCNGATASGSSPDGFGTIGVQIMINARYTYSMVADSSTFTCTATADLDDDPTDDIWQIDETGALVCISDDSRSRTPEQTKGGLRGRLLHSNHALPEGPTQKRCGESRLQTRTALATVTQLSRGCGLGPCSEVRRG